MNNCKYSCPLIMYHPIIMNAIRYFICLISTLFIFFLFESHGFNIIFLHAAFLVFCDFFADSAFFSARPCPNRTERFHVSILGRTTRFACETFTLNADSCDIFLLHTYMHPHKAFFFVQERIFLYDKTPCHSCMTGG